MSDPGRFVDESFRTPSGESSPSAVTEDGANGSQQEDTGASPELTTRSGRKRRFPVQTKSSTKKSKMAKPVTSAEIEAIIKASVGELAKNMGGMESRLKGQLDQVDGKISKTNEELARLDSRVTAQETRNDARIEKLERIVLGQADGPPSSGSSSYSGSYVTAVSTASTLPEHRSARREDHYWTCRKSLRLWPIDGPDLAGGVVSFLETELNFGDGDVTINDFRVERFHDSMRNRQKGEVLVTFSSVSLRDAVRSAAYNLSSQAGMKIHVPDHLKANFRHLDGMCYDLKKKYGKLKRNIKFDDDLLDLYADVQLTPDTPWKKLLPSDARICRAKGKFLPESSSLTADVLGDLLGEDEDTQALSPATGANLVPTGVPRAPPVGRS